MKVTRIRVDGAPTTHNVGQRQAIREIQRLIGATCLDTVNLRDGRVMLVDDTGLIDGRPVNSEATKLYQSVRRTNNSIHGDVVIALDKDFA